MVAEAVAMPEAEAEMCAVPGATPVTGMEMETWPGGMVAVWGTVAAPVLSLERVKVMPLG